MPARKTVRERSRSRMSTKAESESNEVEDISSQSFGDESVNHSRRSSSKIERLSTNSSRRDRRTDDDTEEYLSDARRKKKISKKGTKKSGSKESVDNLSEESLDDKDDEDTSEYKKNRKRRKSKRRSETHSHESTGERDSSSKKGSAKSKRKKRRSPEKEELPITEILKRAQEQRTRYEEPAPLAELTTDTIYVQGRNGFSAMRIGGMSGRRSRKSSEAPASPRTPRPIKVAIGFQKVWRSAGFIFQGLLGGMSMLHLIFMEAYFSDSEEFINSYSALSEIYTSLFSFLIALCIISTFDMFDLAHGNHIRQIFKHHLKSILAIPMYIAAFALHQVTLKVDDKLTLLHYNSSNITYFLVNNVNDTHGDIEVDELKTWQRMTLSKDALAVLSWIFVSVGNWKDMLLSHLEAMNNYAENVNMPM